MMATGLTAAAQAPAPASSPTRCASKEGELAKCSSGADAALGTQARGDFAKYKRDSVTLVGQVSSHESNCRQASDAATRIGTQRGQTANPQEAASMVRNTSAVLRECHRVMGETGRNYLGLSSAADQRLRAMQALSNPCRVAVRALYECMKEEGLEKSNETEAKARQYGSAADQIDPAGAEAERRVRRMGGDPNNPSGGKEKPGGGGEQPGGGASGGDSKKGDDKAGGGGGGSPDMSAMSKMAEQAMKAKQDAEAKAEAERQKAEAERKAQEAREKNARIQACQDTKAKRAAALEQCDWENNPKTNVINVRVANEKCRTKAKADYPVDELTNCALTP